MWYDTIVLHEFDGCFIQALSESAFGKSPKLMKNIDHVLPDVPMEFNLKDW
jgi:hypothetical protein